MMTHPSPPATLSHASHTRQADLLAMLKERQRELGHLFHHRVRDEASHGPNDGLDETEHAEADVQEHIEVALIQMKGDTLARVQEALVRLDAGEYGYCADCEGEISEKRLQALPFAVRCTACEHLHEQRTAREQGGHQSHGFPSFFAQQAGS